MTSDSTSLPPAHSPSGGHSPSSITSVEPPYSTPTEVDLGPLVEADSVLIALDFDGVLAPLQDNPETSRMVPESREAIAQLSTLPGTQVALVSGRDITTLRRLAVPPAEVWLVGSHGAEVDLGAGGSGADPTADERRMLVAIDDHIESFEHSLDTAPTAEFRVERKPYSRTVHTRGFDANFASALHSHVVAVQAEHPGIRVIEGHDITELAVKQATKGDGLRALVAAGSPNVVVYLGDDVTDEDAFAELETLAAPAAENSAGDQGAAQPSIPSLRIKVGAAPTRAPWRITDPIAVAELLGLLADRRGSRHQQP